MTNYKITIEYDGTSFAGWQRQKDVKSIQETIEKAIFELSGEKISLIAAGRTDAGVHAIEQTANFILNKKFENYQIVMGLNHHLRGEDIAILNCEIAHDDFNSRFDAISKSYQYKILNRRAKAVLLKNRVWQIPYPLNIEEMKKAAQFLIGKHDFSSFRDAECQAGSAIKTLDEIKIRKEDEIILIEVTAKSFLHHMVRNIVGTLVLVGGGKIEAKEMNDILKAKDRSKSGPNAPAAGLYFLKCRY